MKTWNVGQGIIDTMLANGDSPAGPSTYKNYDANSKLLPEPLPPGVKAACTVEEAWGSSGLYRADNAQGVWRVSGPFWGP